MSSLAFTPGIGMFVRKTNIAQLAQITNAR
jgi:hypothetical protein